MENVRLYLYLLVFLSTFIAVGFLFFHFWHMIQNLIGKYSGFTGVFCLFMPSQFNKLGNYHRRRFLVFLPIAAILFVLLAVGGSYLGIGGLESIL